jgi:release factor glutamine methyltransferase
MDWTIRALMDWTENHFQKKGLEAPRLEAQLLLAHALNCRRVELYTRWDEVVSDGPRGQFRELVKRRLDGCPAMYLIGRREFYALEFEVSPAVLIPRPETEVLVTEALKRVKDNPEPRILDIGTGSGCIAVALAFQNKSATITATDISSEALDVARRNASKHTVVERIRFLRGDLFEVVPKDECFDVIVSNPPYVAQPEWEQLPVHIREHEPKLALLAGSDGFAVYDRLIPAAVEYLKPGGQLLLEIGATQDDGVRQRLEASGKYEVGSTIRDHAGLPRVVTARRFFGASDDALIPA